LARSQLLVIMKSTVVRDLCGTPKSFFDVYTDTLAGGHPQVSITPGLVIPYHTIPIASSSSSANTEDTDTDGVRSFSHQQPQPQQTNHDGQVPTHEDDGRLPQADKCLDRVRGHPEMCVPCPSQEDCPREDCKFCHRTGHSKKKCLPSRFRRIEHRLPCVRIGIAAAKHRLQVGGLWVLAVELRCVFSQIESFQPEADMTSESTHRAQQFWEQQRLRDIVRWIQRFLNESDKAAVDDAAWQLQQKIGIQRAVPDSFSWLNGQNSS